MLPDGFSKLVALVIENWDWDIRPKKDSDIWDALLSTVFLGATIRTAQAGYIKKVLGNLLSLMQQKPYRLILYGAKKSLKS